MVPPEYDLSTYLWVLWLSWFGGAVAYLQRIKAGGVASFSFWLFIVESMTSWFIGLMTFYVCQYGGMSGDFTAGAIGLAGHMGTRAIFLLRKKLSDLG